MYSCAVCVHFACRARVCAADVKQRKNISNFLTAAAQYGVDEADLFDVDDLLEDNDPFRVLHCLIAYKIAADAK